jgi:hypothetical protein
MCVARSGADQDDDSDHDGHRALHGQIYGPGPLHVQQPMPEPGDFTRPDVPFVVSLAGAARNTQTPKMNMPGIDPATAQIKAIFSARSVLRGHLVSSGATTMTPAISRRITVIGLPAQGRPKRRPPNETGPDRAFAGQGRFRLSQCVRPKGFEPLTS